MFRVSTPDLPKPVSVEETQKSTTLSSSSTEETQEESTSKKAQEKQLLEKAQEELPVEEPERSGSFLGRFLTQAEMRRYQRSTGKRTGVIFDDVEDIPYDPEVDPPAHACLNCWELGHSRNRRPAPKSRHCFNCGRHGIHTSRCPRCKYAWYRDEIRQGNRPRAPTLPPQQEDYEEEEEEVRHDQQQQEEEIPAEYYDDGDVQYFVDGVAVRREKNDDNTQHQESTVQERAGAVEVVKLQDEAPALPVPQTVPPVSRQEQRPILTYAEWMGPPPIPTLEAMQALATLDEEARNALLAFYDQRLERYYLEKKRYDDTHGFTRFY